MLGTPGGHFTLLLQTRVFAFTVDTEGQLLGFEVLFADRNHRVLFDVIALLLTGLDLFGQAGQTFGVEGVGGVEHLHVRLVQAGQRSGFQLQTVVGQGIGHQLLNATDVFAALLVDFFHGHARRHRAHGVDKTALHQVFEAVGVQGAVTQGTRCRRHRFDCGNHPHKELHAHLNTHAVLGDERLLTHAPHIDAQRVHADLGDVVHDRQNQRTAAHDHPFPAKAGSNKREVFGRVPVQPVQQVHNNRDNNRNQDNDSNNVGAVHRSSPPSLKRKINKKMGVHGYHRELPESRTEADNTVKLNATVFTTSPRL